MISNLLKENSNKYKLSNKSHICPPGFQKSKSFSLKWESHLQNSPCS